MKTYKAKALPECKGGLIAGMPYVVKKNLDNRVVVCGPYRNKQGIIGRKRMTFEVYQAKKWLTLI